jgi:thioredoxin 1
MRFLFFITSLLFIFSCKSVDSQTLLSPSDFEAKMAAVSGQLIDVRTPDEFNVDHLANATNLDIYSEKFDSEISKLDKQKTYYVYCQRGGRSANATEKLRKAGFKNVYELDGGVLNWSKEGKPLEKGKLASATEMSIADYSELIKSQKIVLVDFSAKWCGPCKVLSPIVDKIGKQRAKELKVLKLDVDANQALALHNTIDELPTLLWYKNGKLEMRMIGLRTEKDINEMIDKLTK